MSEPRPSFIARFFLSFVASFRTLFDSEFAAGVVALRNGRLPADASASPSREPERIEPPPPVVTKAQPDAALQLLGMLQREGRFIDFLEEDVESFTDEEIGAAARVVHQGCRKTLRQHFEITPIRDEEEGDAITLKAGFDAARIRITGDVAGDPPFKGTLQHRGWRATGINLPKIAEDHDVSILVAAEVEL